MLRIRVCMLGLLVALLVSGVMSASAYAGHTWVVNGTTLASGKTSFANIGYGKLTIKWEESSSKAKFEAECNKASGEAELKGGSFATDKMQSLKLKECVLLKAGKGCELTVGGVTTEELPGWSTELELKSGKIYDGMTGVAFSLILEGCEKVNLSRTWLFRGNLKVEVKNETSKLKAVLPAASVEGDTLKSEGAEASLSGEGEMTEREAGTLQVGFEEEASEKEFWLECAEGSGSHTKYPSRTDCENSESSGSGNWEWRGISSAKSILSKAVGNQVLTVPAAGSEFVCTLLSAHGVIFPGGTDEILSLVYSMCTVAKPAGCGYISSPGEPNGTIVMAPDLPSKLKLTGGGLLVDEVQESATEKEFVTLEIRKEQVETSSKCGLVPKTSTITGTIFAMINNASQTLEFLGEGTLKALGALEAKYTGNVLQELEGGHKFLANWE